MQGVSHYDFLVCFTPKMATHANHHPVHIRESAKTELAATSVIASQGSRASTVKSVPICTLLLKIFHRVWKKLPITVVLGLNKNLKKRKPALSFSALQSFQSCARARMVAVNTSARWSTKTFNAPALMAISWIRITNLVYPMVRMTQKATMIQKKSQGNKRHKTH